MRNLVASACLIIGGYIYITMRSDFRLLDYLIDTTVWPLFNSTRIAIEPSESVLISAFAFSIPDALWCGAFVLYIRSIWEGAGVRGYLTAVGLTISMCFAQELLQLPAILPGTFDLIDLLCIGIAVLVAARAFASETEAVHWRTLCSRMADSVGVGKRSSIGETSSTI